MLPSRCFTALLFCAANHKPTKIPTPLLRTYCAVAATRHIQMPASIGKQPNLYASKQYMPLSYHSSPKNMAPYLNAHEHSKSNFRGGWPCLTLLLGCRMWTASAESNEEEESKKRPLDSTTKKKLFQAIRYNNIEKIEKFLCTYEDVVKARDEDGMTPFLHAAKEGLLEILWLLKTHGADVNAIDEDDNNALHFACMRGRIETAKWLLKNCKINLEATESFERTPFLDAAEEGHFEILRLLKTHGANIDAKNKYGNNALHEACMRGRTETVRWLLNHCNMNLEAKNVWYERTPFLCAAENGHLDILKALEEAGANVNATDKKGNNALHEACWNGHLEMVIWLLDNCDMNLEARGFLGETPFLCAARIGHLQIVKPLKKRGANIDAKNKYGNNALHEACMRGRTETVRWLLNHCNMNLEARGSFERTPFLCAAENGHLDILKALEEAGANVNATDKKGNNALHFAEYYNYKEVKEYLLCLKLDGRYDFLAG